MASKKEFDIRYTPRRSDSKFILDADMQEDLFGVFDDQGILRLGEEIVEKWLHPTEYIKKYDFLYYECFGKMVQDLEWIHKFSEDVPIGIVFHEINNLNAWIKNAEKFEKGVENPLLLMFHPEYKFIYDLIWREC